MEPQRQAHPVKCACERCQCQVPPGKGVVRDGRTYCSETCAYDCTEQTCVCIHETCQGPAGADRRH